MENLQCGNGFLILLHLNIFAIIVEIRPQTQKPNIFVYMDPQSRKRGGRLTANQEQRTITPQFLTY